MRKYLLRKPSAMSCSVTASCVQPELKTYKRITAMIPALAGSTTCSCMFTMRRACSSGSGRKVSSPFTHRDSNAFTEPKWFAWPVSSQQFQRARRNLLNRPQPADSLVTAGEHSFFRANEFRAPRFERVDVLLRCRMQPHLSVHRGRDQDLRLCIQGEGDARQGVIG